MSTINVMEELRFHSEIIANMAEGVFLVRQSDGIIMYANPKFEQIFGYNKKELAGKHVSSVNAPTDLDPVETAKIIIEELHENGEWRGEVKNLKKDGTQFWCFATVTEYDHSKYGKVFVSVHADITDRKKIEAALKASDIKFRGLFHSIRDSILVADTNRTIIDCNTAFSSLFGYSKEEILGKKTVYCYESEEQFLELGRAIKENFDEVNSFLYTVNYKKKNGEVFPGETGVYYLTNDTGETIGFIGLIRNISDRLEAEAALKRSEEMFRVIFEQAGVGVVQAKATDGTFFKLNKKFLDITGYEEQELLGMSFKEITHKEDTEADDTNMEKLMSGEIDQFSMEKRYIRKDKSIVWVNLTVSPMGKSHHDSEFLIGIIEDITDRKVAEEALIQSEARLKGANTTKEKLFSIIAHDLRNPFNTIMGMAGLLETDYDTISVDKQKLYIREISKASKSSYDLLQNLLFWSMSQMQKIETRPERIQLLELITSSINPCNTAALKKGISITTNVSDSIFVLADKISIGRVLSNLVDNAIKFTKPEGEIQIYSKVNKQMTEIFIEDNGIGISQDDIKKLFQIDNSKISLGTQNERGTGLGLLICKEFVELNNGEISVNSHPGRGSAFCFSLPIA